MHRPIHLSCLPVSSHFCYSNVHSKGICYYVLIRCQRFICYYVLIHSRRFICCRGFDYKSSLRGLILSQNSLRYVRVGYEVDFE
ncbi:hypothetical protein GIB67_006810 [Kingdonia uniflora]|uniref:Uncharacterized protein n=1 Tax=Kingdonia uniflora TaxID=39325 RepID=A0A7J7L002_9MAGN|nr:hypothetical protein GIB67_006810 [Kingdonia uniflora]